MKSVFPKPIAFFRLFQAGFATPTRSSTSRAQPAEFEIVMTNVKIVFSSETGLKKPDKIVLQVIDAATALADKVRVRVQLAVEALAVPA